MALKIDALARVRMKERHGLGVEHQTCVVLAIQSVADDRGAEAERVRGVDSQLVQAAGAGEERHPRPAVGPLRDTPLGDGVLAVDRVDDMAGTIVSSRSEAAAR